jgi:hypothetical protein
MLNALVKLPRKGNSRMEHLAIAVKGFMAIALLTVCFSAIYIYRVWSKDTDRKVKIGVMGFSIELGPGDSSKAPVTEDSPTVVPGASEGSDPQK